MIRAVATKADGTKLILLGIDARNVERLKEGKPLHVRGETLDMPGIEIGIMYGETMQDIIDELKKSGIEVPIDREPVVTPDHPVVFRSKKPS